MVLKSFQKYSLTKTAVQDDCLEHEDIPHYGVTGLLGWRDVGAFEQELGD